MRLLRTILALFCLTLSASAADRITATITVTNTPSDGNTLVINGETRTWKTTVATPSTQVAISLSGTANNATNLFLQIAANPFAGPLNAQQSSSSVVKVIGLAGGPLAASLTGTWGAITMSTQTVTTAYGVRVPASSEPDATVREYIWSRVTDGISDESTTSFAAASTAMANFVALSTAQTISGAKTWSSSNTFQGLISVTNAQQYFRTGAGVTLETNLPITDMSSAQARWQFNTAEATNAITTFTDVTNKLTALKAADSSWTGFNTFTRLTGGATNLVTTNSATGAGTHTIGSDLSFSRANHTSLANGNNAGANFGSSTVYAKIKAGPSSAFTINGIAGGRDGRLLILDNATGQSMTIAHDSGTDPTPANRIYTATALDVVVGTDGCVILIYDSESSRWIMVK